MLIYEAKNVITGDIYIGATRRSLECRIREHFRHARVQSAKPFYADLLKYGSEKFAWRILDRFDCPYEMAHAESRLIAENRPATSRYNVTTARSGEKPPGHAKNVASARYGRVHTDATKARISVSKKGCKGPNAGRKFGPSTRDNMRQSASARAKPFVCIETGDVFTSLTQAAASLGVDRSSLQKHLKGKRCTGGKGLTFAYQEGYSHSNVGHVE